MNPGTQIHVALLDEGTDCWRPITALQISGNTYQILGVIPRDEKWEFQPGQCVVCEVRNLSAGPCLVAMHLASTEVASMPKDLPELATEARRTTDILKGKVVSTIWRNCPGEFGIQFTDGTRLFIDQHPDRLEISIT